MGGGIVQLEVAVVVDLGEDGLVGSFFVGSDSDGAFHAMGKDGEQSLLDSVDEMIVEEGLNGQRKMEVGRGDILEL